LEALLGRPLGAGPDGPEQKLDGSRAAGDGLPKVSVYEIENNPFQPRQDFDDAAIADLAQSIKEHGMIQPLVVRRQGERYQLIAGERRLRAAIKAGWSEVPVQVREADDRQMTELAMVENLQRKDLNPLEKAASFQQYLDRYRCTQEELAGRLQIDRSTVANLIRLLELPAAVQDAVRGGTITQGHARALLPLGDEREQLDFCRRIQEESLSVRAIEEMVQELIHQADNRPLSVVGGQSRRGRPTRRSSEHLASLGQELRAALGTKVDVRQGAKGRGRIVVHFGSHEEFERLRELLCRPQRHSQAG
jgi:ParB family chromosome partitioning protein